RAQPQQTLVTATVTRQLQEALGLTELETLRTRVPVIPSRPRGAYHVTRAWIGMALLILPARALCG
ncbi:hypothetical protein NDU88_003908, partial [Pleurodeles waltl]